MRHYRHSFQYAIVTGSITLPVTIICALILWATAYINQLSTFNFQLSTLGSLAATAFIVYSLIEVNTAYSFIRTGTSFHTSLFLLTFTAVPSLYVFGIDYLIPCLFILLLGMLFGSLDNAYAPASVFNSFLCLGLMTTLDPYLIVMTPFMFLELQYLRSFTSRTFLAAIMGLCLPYWFIWGYAAYADDYPFLLDKLQALIRFSPIEYTNLRIDQYITYAFILLLSIFGGYHTYVSSYKEKVHTRLMLHVAIMMQIVLCLMLILQPNHFNSLVSMQIVLSSILAGYMFQVVFTPFTRIFSYVTITLWLTMTTVNLWTLFKIY